MGKSEHLHHPRRSGVRRPQWHPDGRLEYRFLNSFRPDGEMSRDMTLFADEDGKAYLITASEENQTMHVHLLSPDYLTTSGKWERIFVHRCSAAADFIWGPWKELGNPAQGADADTTYGSQTAYVLPVEGKPGAFVGMGDRWRPENLVDSRYVWLPVQFTGERLLFRG